MKQRVVITGVGVLTSLGMDKETFWNNLINGKSGIKTVTRFDTTGYPTRIGGQIDDFDPTQYIDRKEARRMDRGTQFAVAATRFAVEDSKMDLGTLDLERIGVIFGSGTGGIETMEDQSRTLMNKGPGRISPFFVPMFIANMPAGQIAITFGFKGPNVTTVTACASSTNSVGDAFRLIQRGDADAVITGGCEAPITPLAMAGFCAARTMSTRNEEPEKASRPFDAERDGFVMGEGAGVLILESLEHALKRGAHIYAEMAGYGCTCDAYHITAPHPEGEGAARAMSLALKDAEMKPEDVDYINAHGTSTALNDKLETLAIKKALGEHAYKVAVSSTKSMTGHLLGAAGGIETIVCAMTIERGIIPPTINYEHPDPECDLDYVPNKARQQDVDVAMSNSLGFGGHNATVVVKQYIP